MRKYKEKSKEELMAELAEMRQRIASLEKLTFEHDTWDEEYKSFFNLSNNIFCIAGLDGYFKFVNPALIKTLGYTEEELLMRPFLELVHPEDRDNNEAEVREITSGRAISYCEHRYRCKDGSYKLLSWHAYTDIDRGLIYAVGRDITEQKQAEDILRNSEKKYRDLVDNALVGIYRTNLRGDILYVNEALVRIFEFDSQGEMMQDNVLTKYKNPKDREVLIENLKKTGRVSNFEIEIITKKGKTKNALLNAILDGDVISGMIMDVTYQKQAEEALQKARAELEMRVKERTAELIRLNDELVAEIKERRQMEEALRNSESRFKRLSQEFHTLLDAIPDTLILLSPELKIMWVNKAAASQFAMDVSELKGQYCYRLCCNLSSPHEKCPILKSFRTGREETAQISCPGGRYLDIRAFPIKGESGRVKKVIEVTRDVTTKIHTEEKAKLFQAKLIHANKMASLGILVSGIAHEINNPNSFIMSNAQLLSEIWRDARQILGHSHKDEEFYLGGLPFSELDEVIPRLLKGVNDGCVRIQKIVSNLVDFARPEKNSLDGRIDVNKAIIVSRSILNNQIKKYTENFHMVMANNIPPVKGSEQQMEQVIINLIMNSLQALPDRNRKVCVSTSFNEEEDKVIIQVRDEGVGIPENILERITEPFFTTKLDLGGTGLGLFISYSIVNEHNGSLEFESEPGKGTVATVRLPACNT